MAAGLLAPMLAPVGLFSGCASRAPAVSAAAPDRVAPFARSGEAGGLPKGWEPLVLRRDKRTTDYAVARDGQRSVLHAHADKAASALQCRVHINPLTQPRLRWSWRASVASAATSVADSDTDDSPTRLFIAFDGDHARLSIRDRLLFEQAELFTGHRPPFATLSYVWCGQSELDTQVANHRTKRLQYHVVESGIQHSGQWLQYERNLVLDYRRAFGEAPGPVIAVGVLTDSDATGSNFEAWYGDITIVA